LPENNLPDDAEFFFAFKARNPAHSELCNGLRNAEGGKKASKRVCYWTEIALELVLHSQATLQILGLFEGVFQHQAIEVV